MPITITLTPDEVANVQTALEHFLDYLKDHGTKDYDLADDLEGIKASYQSALEKIEDAAYKFFTRPTKEELE